MAIVMFDSDNDAQSNYRGVGASAGSARRRRWSVAERAAITRQTLVPGARISDVARRWQGDPHQVYRWRHSEDVTHHRRPMRGRRPAASDFVPIVADAMPADAATPAGLANSVIEISLAGAVVRVVSGLDDA